VDSSASGLLCNCEVEAVDSATARCVGTGAVVVRLASVSILVVCPRDVSVAAVVRLVGSDCSDIVVRCVFESATAGLE